MKIKTYFAKLNSRLLLVHLIATWFVMYGFHELSFLHNLEFVDWYRKVGYSNAMRELIRTRKDSISEITYLVLIPQYAILGAKIVCLIISLVICRVNRWFWVNSLLIFLFFFVPVKTEFSAWYYLKGILHYPGYLFNNTALVYTINGTYLIAIGLFLFFSPVIKRFINKNNNQPETTEHYSFSN